MVGKSTAHTSRKIGGRSWCRGPIIVRSRPWCIWNAFCFWFVKLIKILFKNEYVKIAWMQRLAATRILINLVNPKRGICKKFERGDFPPFPAFLYAHRPRTVQNTGNLKYIFLNFVTFYFRTPITVFKKAFKNKYYNLFLFKKFGDCKSLLKTIFFFP